MLADLPDGPHDVHFVDDGSTDGTAAWLEDVSARDSRICLLKLSRNFGTRRP